MLKPLPPKEVSAHESLIARNTKIEKVQPELQSQTPSYFENTTYADLLISRVRCNSYRGSVNLVTNKNSPDATVTIKIADLDNPEKEIREAFAAFRGETWLYPQNQIAWANQQIDAIVKDYLEYINTNASFDNTKVYSITRPPAGTTHLFVTLKDNPARIEITESGVGMMIFGDKFNLYANSTAPREVPLVRNNEVVFGGFQSSVQANPSLNRFSWMEGKRLVEKGYVGAEFKVYIADRTDVNPSAVYTRAGFDELKNRLEEFGETGLSSAGLIFTWPRGYNQSDCTAYAIVVVEYKFKNAPSEKYICPYSFANSNEIGMVLAPVDTYQLTDLPNNAGPISAGIVFEGIMFGSMSTLRYFNGFTPDLRIDGVRGCLMNLQRAMPIFTFPNPVNISSEPLNVEMTGKIGEKYTLSLIDLYGRKVHEETFEQKMPVEYRTLSLDGTQIPSGAYILTRSDSKGVHSTKVIIEK